MKALHASEPQYNKYESIKCFRTKRVQQNMKHYMCQNLEGTTKYESITCVRTTRLQQNMKALHASEPRGYNKI